MRKTQLFLRPLRDGGKWLGIGHIKFIANYTRGVFTSLVRHKPPEVRFESFDQAIAFYKLSEADLIKLEKRYLLLAVIYFAATLAMCGYAISLFYIKHYLAFISALSVAMMILSFSFREHFWYIQVKHRHLGLDFLKWLQLTFRK